MALNLHRFRTPAQRNRSIGEQMRRETKRQSDLNDQEVKRLQNLMRVETQRQQLLEGQENDRTGREFKVEQQRQRDLDGRERIREVEQRQQPGVRDSGRTFAAGTTTPEERLALSAGPTPEEFEAGLRAQAGKPGLLEAIDVPRQIVKRELIDPVVPEFEFDVPREAVTGRLGPLGAAVEAVGAVSGLAGGPELPEDIPITSALVEEAASWVADPLNAAFFIGPALKGAGGAARVANQIRKTGRIPAFVRAARKLAASEAGGGRLGDIQRLRGLGFSSDDARRIVRGELDAGDAAEKLLSQKGVRFTERGVDQIVGEEAREFIADIRGTGIVPSEGHQASIDDAFRLLESEIDSTIRGGRVPPTGPLRGGRVFPEEITPARVSEELRGFEPPTTPPREPPTAPPRGPGGGLTPDDASFDPIQDVGLKGEAPEVTLVRRQEGAINTIKQESALEVSDGNKLLKEADMGTSFRGTRVPKLGQIDEFDELNRLLHNPSKVESGELVVPERMRAAYDKLRQQTDWEQIARLEFDPDMALAEDYFYRGWKPPDNMFTGEGTVRGSLGRRPDFKLPRVDATYDEMRAAGFEPLFWNPFEQQRASRLMGIRYREQEKLIRGIKEKGLAVTHQGGPVPEGWRTPRIGPAFEGKPYAVVDEAGAARVMFTRRWIVPDSMADRLENVFGVPPKLGKLGKVDVIKVIDALTFIPKRAKLIASVFQHVDFLTRSHIGAWTGMGDALRAGQPIEAVKSLAKWPDSAYQLLRASVDPGFRTNLRRQILSTKPLIKERPNLSMRLVSENGLSVTNPTILPDDLDVIAREIAQEALGPKIVKAPGRALAAFERVWRQGLFEGVYPAAILTDIRNNIAPIVARNYLGLTDAQMAGRIASIANKKYSTIPASMSVIQNRAVRETLRRVFFSIGENEGLLRQAAGAVRGPEAAFWRTHWIGAFIGLIVAANVIHVASTGKPLPFERYTPISKTKYGILPIGYNRDFAAPDIPLTGRSGTEITLDLVGQMDTALRVLDPVSFISARESVPVRAIQNQIAGTDFFGASIDDVGPQGIVSRTAQLAFDMFAPIGIGQSALELIRSKIEGAETIIRPGEDRLGTTGTLVQATGVNLRAETTPQLLDRIRADVIRESEIEAAYEDLDLPRKREVDVEVENRIGGELELRQETAKLRGQITPESQFFEEQEISRTLQEENQLADDAKLNSNQWPGDVWRDKFRDRNRDFFNQREGLKQAFKIEFGDRDLSNKVDIAINAYFDVNVDDYPDVDNPGRTDWGAFFAAQDAALSPLSPGDRKRVEDFIHKFDTPTVKEFRGAQDIVDRFWDMPKYEGLSLKEGQELDKFLNVEVEEFQRRTLREMGRTFRTRIAILILADQIGLPEKLLNVALLLRRERFRAQIINPERDEFLIQNERILSKFYPDLLEQQLSRAQEAELGQQAFEAIAAR